MNRRLKGFSLLIAVMALSSVVMFSGCSSNLPLSPDYDQAANLDGQLLGKTPIIPFLPAIVTAVVADISAESGGSISIPRSVYLHEFIVQEDALNQDTQISIKTSQEKILSKDAIIFEFGPDGLVFRKASKLDFEMAELNPNANKANLYYYDPRIRNWLLQDTQPVKNGRAEFDIYHFSKYAISK